MRRFSLQLIIVALLAFLVFIGTVRYGFVWDDKFLILDNRYLKDWSELKNNLTSDFFRKTRDTSLIGYWRPVITLSYMIDRTLYNDQPWGFHLMNVILHVLGSCLVLVMLARLPLPRGVPLGAAFLFAVHPVHVESVAWVSGRTDLFCAVFFIASLALDYADSRDPDWKKRWGSVICTLLALLSKEMAVVLPGLIAFRVLLLPGETEKERGITRSAVHKTLPHAIVLFVYMIVHFIILNIGVAHPAWVKSNRFVLFFTWWNGFLEYLRTLVWPAVLSIAIEIRHEASILSLSVIASIALFAFLLFLSWRIRKTHPVLSFTLLFFLISFIPLTNFISPISAPASAPFAWNERFMYIPSVAFCLLASWVVMKGLPELTSLVGLTKPSQVEKKPAKISSKKASKNATQKASQMSKDELSSDQTIHPPMWAIVLFAVIIIASFSRSIIRANDWKDNLSLFSSALKHAPNASLVHLNYAVALADLGRPDEAERSYLKALDLEPLEYRGYYNLGNVYRERGELEKAESAYRSAIRIKPSHAQSHLNLGLVFLNSGRNAEALEAFAKADELLPDYVDAKVNHANILHLLDRSAEAIPIYQEALKIEPVLPAARLGLAGALMDTGRSEEAAAILQRLIHDEPDLTEAHLLLAVHFDRKGMRAEAEKQYREVLRLDPGNEKVRQRLGLITNDPGQKP